MGPRRVTESRVTEFQPLILPTFEGYFGYANWIRKIDHFYNKWSDVKLQLWFSILGHILTC